ncbi:MAG: hypothetical protein JNK38_14070 [Acidobacteria bacterium]|nr:hypothetical protein [Acidobacteriota bacterium]
MRLIKLFAAKLSGIPKGRQRERTTQQKTFDSIDHFFSLSVVKIGKRSISQRGRSYQFPGGFVSEVSGHLLLGLPVFAVVW